MSILNFFTSPIGLGHVTRDIAIAENLTGISPRFVTGSSAALFLEKAGFDVQNLYRPPRFMVNGGRLENTARWLWNYYRYYTQCKAISNKVIHTDDPDIVVSDEDFASLAVAQEAKIPTVLITDVLETHFTKGVTSFVEKKMNKSMRDIIKKCDAVIIPEEGQNCENITRVGPIVRNTSLSRDEIRKKFSFDKKTILVSVGGTDAGKFLIDKVLDILPQTRQHADIVIVSGPSLNAHSKQTRNLGFVDNLHELVFAADVLVSLAGKSTIDEAKSYGTPGIFIPVKDHFEQEDNARAEGFCFEDIYRLDDLILEKLAQGRKPVMTSGATTASDIIKGML